MNRGSGLRIGKILGIPIYLHSTWVFIFAAITYVIASQYKQQHPLWTDTQHWTVGVLTSLLFFASVLFHELAHSNLLHAKAPVAVDIALGASELLPMVAILPFLLYQLAGFGTLHFVVSRAVNWIVNAIILAFIIASYVYYRQGDYGMEKKFAGSLVIVMVFAVFYGVLKLRQMQANYDARAPQKTPK